MYYVLVDLEFCFTQFVHMIVHNYDVVSTI